LYDKAALRASNASSFQLHGQTIGQPRKRNISSRIKIFRPKINKYNPKHTSIINVTSPTVSGSSKRLQPFAHAEIAYSAKTSRSNPTLFIFEIYHKCFKNLVYESLDEFCIHQYSIANYVNLGGSKKSGWSTTLVT